MLDGHVNIRENLGRIPNCGDELVSHSLRLEIQDAQPCAIRPHDFRKAHEKARKGVVLAEILAPNARILTNEDELPDALLRKGLDLGDDLAIRPRGIAPANIGDRAEGAETVASIRDLDVRARALNGTERLGKRAGSGALGSWDDRFSAQDAVNDPHDPVLGIRPNESCDLGEFGRKIVAVS